MTQEEKMLNLCEPGTCVITPYKNAKTPFSVSCSKGHVRSIIGNNLVQRGNGAICKECVAPSIKTRFFNILKEKSITLVGNYIATTAMVVVRGACGHEYSVLPDTLVSRGTGVVCPVCRESGDIVGTYRNKFFTKLLANDIALAGEYTGVKDVHTIQYNICLHTHSVTPSNLVQHSTGIICRICYPNLSIPEQELREFISNNYDGWVENNNRDIISPQELDVVLPDLGLAFEMDGEYWHHEERKGPLYHLNKTEAVESVEYQLIHITDIQWATKQNIVKSRILALLGKSTKIMARKCIVNKLDSMPREFLDANHIQGAGAPTGINYGLFHGDTLVAVMTFKKTSLNGAEYELVRYCSLLNTTIVGGAGKLLKAFEREYNSPSIMSYAARDWSKGGLYTSLGFTHLRNTEPGYHYFKGMQTFSRQTFQKAKLQALFPEIYEKAKSEKDIMTEAGYRRYYDSGNMVFIKNTLETL